jgi:tRNA/rRNA methyltransferase
VKNSMLTSLTQIRIVLVEPAGALNVGSVARVMKNLGLQQLILVNPQCDPLGDEARKMAVHAADILEAAQQVPTLVAALADCQRIIATTGLEDITLPVDLEAPRAALPWLLEPGFTAALLFGREDRGLTRSELNYAQRLVQIPSSPAYTSFNLAQAVAICGYELFSLTQAPAAPIATPPIAATPDLAQFADLERYFQQLETMLLRIGYLYPHTAASRMEKIRRLFGRTQLSTTELAMLQGMVSQISWALDNSASQS